MHTPMQAAMAGGGICISALTQMLSPRGELIPELVAPTIERID